MTVSSEFLPQECAGKSVGVWGAKSNYLSADFETLGCTVVPLDLYPDHESLKKVDFFVLDGTTLLGARFKRMLSSFLASYTEIANDRPCYTIIPYGNIDYNWDVVNNATPTLGNDSLPGPRWIYDELLKDFTSRSVGKNILHKEKIQCMFTRISPLHQTLMCIMATSGHGKTTLVRQLTNKHGIAHTSSDFLLASILKTRLSESSSTEFTFLKNEIAKMEPDKVWGRFFRLLGEDEEALRCFLEMAWQNMQFSGVSSLLSFDIDLRETTAKEFTINFFRQKKLKVWECNT